MKNRIWTAVGIMVIFMVTGCGGDCKTFENEVPETITPNLREHLGGLLTNTTWVLANDVGDTLIINAVGALEEDIQENQDGNSTECRKAFRAWREFRNTINGHIFHNSFSAFTLDLNSFRVLAPVGYKWDISSDTLVSNSGIRFYDSLQFGQRWFRNVYMNAGEDSSSFDFALTSKDGFIAFDDNIQSSPLYLRRVY